MNLPPHQRPNHSRKRGENAHTMTAPDKPEEVRGEAKLRWKEDERQMSSLEKQIKSKHPSTHLRALTASRKKEASAESKTK